VVTIPRSAILFVGIAIAILMLIAGLLVIQTIYITFSKQSLRYAVVKPVKIEKSSIEYRHVAEVYADGERIRGIDVWVRKPLNSSSPITVPLTICIGWIKESRVKSLEIQFIPPPTKFTELAWISSLGNAVPVEFYVDEGVVVFRFRDLQPPYGYGTMCQDFLPKILGFDFSSYTIHIKTVIEYNSLDYLADYTITVE